MISEGLTPFQRPIDFKALNEELLNKAGDLLPEWLPGGKFQGREWVCGSIRGEPGSSLKFNVEKGVGQDFATDQKFGDMIALYAAIEGVGMVEAALACSSKIGFGTNAQAPSSSASGPEPKPKAKRKPKVKHEPEIGKPPVGCPVPEMRHPVWGLPVKHWSYTDAAGDVLFYVARYESGPDAKEFFPWCYDLKASKWIAKSYPGPVPLYGLKDLTDRPEKQVMIVEGEKAADAARSLVGRFSVAVSWSGGCKAYAKSDWSVLKGRRVILWPDSDRKVDRETGELLPYNKQPGASAMAGIAKILSPIAAQIKIVNVSDPGPWQVDGFDAADALNAGWTEDDVIAFLKSRVEVYDEKLPAVVEETEQPGQAPEPEVLPPEDDEADLTLHEQLEVESSPATSKKFIALWEQIGIDFNIKTQKPVTNVDNIVRCFQSDKFLGDLVWYDTFHANLMTNWKVQPGAPSRIWSDQDTREIELHFQRRFGFQNVDYTVLNRAIYTYAEQDSRKKSEPAEWLNSLQWDEEPRLEMFLTNAFGCDNSLYHAQVGTNFFISMVARILRPGCKADTMMVLEGRQGSGKSQAMRIIGGRWFTESSQDISSKDFKLSLAGNMLIELGELQSLNKADRNKIKQILSDPEDQVRRPYDRHPIKLKRQSIFVGTTNESVYLDDPTGARRFWPVKTKKVDLKFIEAARQHLFAEAVWLFKKGYPWWIIDKDEAEEQQRLRQTDDVWEEEIALFLNVPMKTKVSVKEIAVDLFKVSLMDLDRRQQMRIAHILQKLGWHKAGQGRGSLGRVVYWERGEL